MNNVPDRDPPHDITRLLQLASQGDNAAFDEILARVYDELKRVARARLRNQRPGHTLSATALVHETYLKLVDHADVEWHSRVHFFAVASNAMRQILVDYAKWKNAGKRGGGAPHLPLDDADALSTAGFLGDDEAAELIALNDALDRLAAFDPRGAEVVQYRFFGGLSHQEIADVLGMSEITVRRAWTTAKMWLRRELAGEGRAPTVLREV